MEDGSRTRIDPINFWCRSLHFLLLYLLTTFLLLSLTSATELKVGLLNFCGKEELLLVWTFYKHKNLCNTLKERIMHDVSPLLPAPTFLFEDKRVN